MSASRNPRSSKASACRTAPSPPAASNSSPMTGRAPPSFPGQPAFPGWGWGGFGGWGGGFYAPPAVVTTGCEATFQMGPGDVVDRLHPARQRLRMTGTGALRIVTVTGAGCARTSRRWHGCGSPSSATGPTSMTATWPTRKPTSPSMPIARAPRSCSLSMGRRWSAPPPACRSRTRRANVQAPFRAAGIDIGPRLLLWRIDPAQSLSRLRRRRAFLRRAGGPCPRRLRPATLPPSAPSSARPTTPAKPADAVPLDDFWRKRGFTPYPQTSAAR